VTALIDLRHIFMTISVRICRTTLLLLENVDIHTFVFRWIYVKRREIKKALKQGF